jgi:spermidine/putrescine transport system permease protein
MAVVGHGDGGGDQPGVRLFLNRRFLRGPMKKSGAGFKVYALGYLVFLYAPIVLLPMFAFNDGTIIAFPLQGSRPSGSRRCGATRRWRGGEELADHRGASAVLATCAWHLCRPRRHALRFPGKGGIMGLIMLPLVLPEIIVAVSLLVVFAGAGDQPVDLDGDPGPCADLHALLPSRS